MNFPGFHLLRSLLGLPAIICLLLYAVEPVNFSYAAPSDVPVAMEQPADEAPDLQWFKEEMRISDQYVDRQEGVFGMSWAHFFTMIILGLFAVWALVGIVIRYKRTQQLLEAIRKEE
jgi:hypothetical protein